MGASKISIVGMDGYTLYGKDKYDKGEKNQHCYNYYNDNTFFKKTGYTDIITYLDTDGKEENKKNNFDVFYNHSLKKDKDVYNSLCTIREFGVSFSIITPTIYSDFYSPKIKI